MITHRGTLPRLQFPPAAYRFLFAALRWTQESLGRCRGTSETASSHVTGRELVDGIRDFALQHFGLMTTTVFRQWGVHSTDDFGRMVFEMVQRGEMSTTERDRPSDFHAVYDFHDAFDRHYRIDTASAFSR